MQNKRLARASQHHVWMLNRVARNVMHKIEQNRTKSTTAWKGGIPGACQKCFHFCQKPRRRADPSGTWETFYSPQYAVWQYWNLGVTCPPPYLGWIFLALRFSFTFLILALGAERQKLLS